MRRSWISRKCLRIFSTTSNRTRLQARGHAQHSFQKIIGGGDRGLLYCVVNVLTALATPSLVP